MRSTTDIIFGVTGQSLLYRVPQGRPSSATFEVFHDSATDDAEPEWSGTATVDSVDSTLAAAAGLGQDDRSTFSLASGGGTNVVAGRRYLLSQNGFKEWVLVAGKSGDDITASAPLQNSYTTGADFEGTHITADVDASWVADEANLGHGADPIPDYRVRWLIVIGSTTVVAYSFFDLVRGALEHGITFHDLESRFWGALENMPVDHRSDQGARLLTAAWEDLTADLQAGKIKASALRDASLVDQLLLRRIRVTFAENGHAPPNLAASAFLDYAHSEYDRFLEKHFLLSSEVAIADGTGGASARTKASPPGWRS